MGSLIIIASHIRRVLVVTQFYRVQDCKQLVPLESALLSVWLLDSLTMRLIK